jgi:predicted dehydrogenase
LTIAARIALIGAGSIGREHGLMLMKHPETHLVGIADTSSDARSFAMEHNIPFFHNFEQMLDDLQPDGAIIALPNTLHEGAGLACLSRRIPVLIEKPIADTVQAALKIVDASESLGVPVLVGHHRRHSSDIQGARKAIEDGELGEIVAVNGMWFTKKHNSYFDSEWRRRAGGGPFLINLVHDIDCFLYLLGGIESVWAVSSNKVRNFEVEDTGAVIMKFKSGVLGTFILSDTVPSPYTWDVASGQAPYIPEFPENCYFIGGTKACLAVPGMDLWRYPNEGDWRDHIVKHHKPIPKSSCYWNQVQNFVDVIRGRAKPVVSARDGTTTLAVTQAIQRSAETSTLVMIDERRQIA